MPELFHYMVSDAGIQLETLQCGPVIAAGTRTRPHARSTVTSRTAVVHILPEDRQPQDKGFNCGKLHFNLAAGANEN